MTGMPVPLALIPLWDRGNEVQELMTYISAVRSKVKKFQEEPHPLFVRANFSEMTAAGDRFYAELKTSKPYAICAACQGEIAEGCPACLGIGMVSEHFWNNCVTEQDRNMRAKLYAEES